MSSLQLNPETDWMYTADAGGVGCGLNDGGMVVPRGKMLGGTSGINYMAYVRGHPGDFDAWADAGADGWAYADVLPYFKKSEGIQPSGDIVVDTEAHSTEGRRAHRCRPRCRSAPGGRPELSRRPGDGPDPPPTPLERTLRTEPPAAADRP